MIILLIILITVNGRISTKTIPFDTEKHCQMAAQQIEQKKSNHLLEVQTLCLKHTLKS